MTQTQYSPIDDYEGFSAPDSAQFDLAQEKLKILPKAVVVRAKNGDIINRYEDDTWELKHYGGATSINFNKFGNDKETAKQLMYTLLMFGGNRDNGVPGEFLCSIFRTLYRISEKSQKFSMTLEHGLADANLMYNYSTSVAISKASNVSSHLKLLREIGIYVDVNVSSDLQYRELLEENGKSYTNKVNIQFPIIPIDIFSEAYNQRWEHFLRIDEHINNLCIFISKYGSDPYFGRSYVQHDQDRHVKWKLVPFTEAVKQSNLEELFKYYNVSGHETLVGFINNIILNCGHLIAGSTGMRNDELKMLLQGCFIQATDRRPPTITGYEKKGNKGIPREQDWITSVDMAQVVVMLEKLGSAMLYELPISNTKKIPLFIRTSAFSSRKIRNKDLVYNIDLINKLTIKGEAFIDESQLILTQDMMDNFLKKTHLPGRWDKEKRLKVGKPWKFSWHQYRRTFAFLAINSGLVSLSALQQQLTHSLQSISAYYSNGALNIEPLITDGKNHITKEIDEQRREQAAIALTMDVLANKNFTTIAINNWAKKLIDIHRSNPQEFASQAIIDTKKEIKKGNLYVKETPIGKCTSPDACDSFLTFTFMDCGSCDYSNPDESKINRSIDITELSIIDLINQGFPEDSYEVRTQKKELSYFEAQKNKIKNRI
jgi:hypothetical protein